MIISLLLSYSFLNAQTTPFKSVEWLQENLDREDLVILHVGPEDAYLEKHIPGAHLVGSRNYTFTSDDETQVYDLPPVENLVAFLESKGVDNGDTIIIYAGTNGISPTTRLYFTLDYLGYSNNTFYLDGGLPLWEHEGGQTTSEIPKTPKGSFIPKANPGLVVPISFVKENLSNESLNIVDARSPVYYEGIQESMGSKGHIPGAKTIPYTSIVNEGPNGSYILKSKDQIQKIFDEQGLDKNTPIIVYCHIGQQATLVYFATKILGYNARLFDGSMHAWGHDSNNPLEVN
ncbi:MAG: sulfurtransferase [Balneolaceae bacterium]|nr:sulfurtransferase [Balneolaceae bacterium]MBO6545229.1 sulfurtransferase [Balneolaceae bacterium]MBO6646625.1 sulfurtransferase [Balneolaceae bacterium]